MLKTGDRVRLIKDPAPGGGRVGLVGTITSTNPEDLDSMYGQFDGILLLDRDAEKYSNCSHMGMFIIEDEVEVID